MKNWWLLSFAFLFTSCGWRFSDSYSKDEARTISIPYVHGDDDGLLTAELVNQVEKEGNLLYVQDGGELTLQVTLLDSESENIGFRFDPKKLSNGKKKLIPDEVRRKLLAKVTVINRVTDKPVLGPAYILGSCEFDHHYYRVNHNMNNFSLGQFTDITTAYDTVDIPLHRDLARKIAEYLANNLPANTVQTAKAAG